MNDKYARSFARIVLQPPCLAAIALAGCVTCGGCASLSLVRVRRARISKESSMPRLGPARVAVPVWAQTER